MFELLDEDQKASACGKVFSLLPSEWIGLEKLMQDPFPPFTRSPALLTGVVSRLRDEGRVELRKAKGRFEIRRSRETVKP